METPTVINPARLAKLEAKAPQTFPPLVTVTKPNLTTEELAFYSNMKPQSWRVKACYDTAPEGLRPLRVCGKLAWPTAGAKRLLGVQAGFASIVLLAGIAALVLLVQAFAPGLFDLTSFAMLGAGVLVNRESRQYFDQSALATAATSQGCTVHLHQEADVSNVFSVGNSNTGPREFSSYAEALAWIEAKAEK